MSLDKRLIDKMKTLGYDSSFSYILFLLYKLSDDPKYATLSELPFLMNKENLLTFLDYYGGKTITLPTKQQLLNVISALSIMQQTSFKNLTDNEVEEMVSDIQHKKEILNCYRDIQGILSRYEFN